jgi:hypothetical protein
MVEIQILTQSSGNAGKNAIESAVRELFPSVFFEAPSCLTIGVASFQDGSVTNVTLRSPALCASSTPTEMSLTSPALMLNSAPKSRMSSDLLCDSEGLSSQSICIECCINNAGGGLIRSGGVPEDGRTPAEECETLESKECSRGFCSRASSGLGLIATRNAHVTYTATFDVA